jgi:hypothetical protein
MGHCYHHALSSVRKWGGIAEDYLPLHQWFDVMWTRKLFLLISPAEVVVPVVHRRAPPKLARIAVGGSQQGTLLRGYEDYCAFGPARVSVAPARNVTNVRKISDPPSVISTPSSP